MQYTKSNSQSVKHQVAKMWELENQILNVKQVTKMFKFSALKFKCKLLENSKIMKFTFYSSSKQKYCAT